IALSDITKPVDIGEINGQYFINVAAMGCLVDLSQRTDPNLKNTLGVLAYYLQGMVELPNLRPITMRFESEEFTGEEKVYFALVMNGKSAGSFKHLATPAEVNDGKMDVLLFKETPAKDFPALALSILTGQHRENKNVIYFQTSHIKIDTQEEIGADVDGETAGAFPLEITVVPRRLQILTGPERPERSEENMWHRMNVVEDMMFNRIRG
ncbi:MAG: YegS/Rv2252/BmrU family lipid kinase, partial [Firmicutes bacterium]|nr:YegS/Rv2252/BmrU family lipid kinase [Bacillota bacterium]